jgi:hypothetical protein
MKTNFTFSFLTILILFSGLNLRSQDLPTLIINSDTVSFGNGLSLPFWVKSGNNIVLYQNVSMVSIIEFETDSSELIFSNVINLTSDSLVPNGKIWKIEAIGLEGSSGALYNNQNQAPPSPKVFDYPGTYNWKVPPGVTKICIEVWGGGGNGGIADPAYFMFNGAGGGGGGYGYGCYAVTLNQSFIITVGEASQTSSVGTLISATGGSNATVVNNNPIAGIGGASTAYYNINGSSGGNGTQSMAGKGGCAGNGGAGGIKENAYSDPLQSQNFSEDGHAPGGGGMGAIFYLYSYNPGKGAPGRVIIYW